MSDNMKEAFGLFAQKFQEKQQDIFEDKTNEAEVVDFDITVATSFVEDDYEDFIENVADIFAKYFETHKGREIIYGPKIMLDQQTDEKYKLSVTYLLNKKEEE
jgi:hypothetical protein